MSGLLTGNDALAFLASRTEAPEKSRSAYWEGEARTFSITADGRVKSPTVLGNISTKTGPLHTAAHWVLQWPFRRMGRHCQTYKECEQLGRMIAGRQGRQFTHDMIRQVLSLALIRRYVNLDRPTDCNLVIGDGLGVLSSLFLLATPHRRTILVNISKPLLLDLLYADKAVPDLKFALVAAPDQMEKALSLPDIRLIAVQADNASVIAEAPIGVAANVVSMQEMTPPVIAEYFRILRVNKAEETAFYCCNKLLKRFSDGAEARFYEYPWRPSDRILHDAVCPWSQWLYSKKPPFWSYRRGKHRVIWHRLAFMTKEPT